MWTVLVAVILLVAAPCCMCAQQQQQQPDVTAHMQQLFILASRNVRNAKCVVYADSLRQISHAVGNKDAELSSYTIKMKHYSLDFNAVDELEKSAKATMDFALANNFIDAFYSAVSFKVTFYTNRGEYDKAFDFQEKMLDYAKKHGHKYGIIIGHISLGNVYRMRMQMVKAIDEYRQALDNYHAYNIKHDTGIDYKRIVECYIIVGHFEKALATADKGLQVSNSRQSISGLYGYKAFAMFMLDRDRDFIDNYNHFKHLQSEGAPDVQPLVVNCLDVMKLIYDGKYKEVDERMKKPGMGAFKQYVEIAYYKRRGEYEKVLEAMRAMNINLYGNSTGSLAANGEQMSASVNNNLVGLDKERAEGVNSRLKLISTNLELKNTELELTRFKDAEQLALVAAEAKRLSLNNQKLLSRQLRDSLARTRLQRAEDEQRQRANRVHMWMLFIAASVLTLLGLRYLLRNSKMTHELGRTNDNLQATLKNLSVANDQAQESDRQKTKFIQSMSHEIRTPLNAIVGFSQILTDDDSQLSEEERKNITDIINNNSEVLNTLVNDILDLTSLETGKYVMKKEDVPVNSLCHHALDSTRHRKADGVHLRLETELPDDFMVKSDSYRLQQVLVNLLTNAMKNTTKGSIVLSCSLSERPGLLTFTVTDTGIGVPRDKQEKIFERFCKLDQFKQGVGLGLDICRIIAKRLGGAVDIDHDYTGGARFWFAIPV